MKYYENKGHEEFSKMKIRIVTYHKVINRGALLQAYGLQLNFKTLFPDSDVKIIDKLPLSFSVYELLRAIPQNRGGLQKWRRYKLINKDANRTLSLEKMSLKKVSRLLSKEDILVSGSDCIWRITKKFPFPPFPNQYWLPYKTDARKISFSTSAFGTDVSLLESNKEKIHDLISDFSIVSVRDKFTKNIINRDDATITPDPSFFVPINGDVSYPDTILSFFKKHPKPCGLQIYHDNYPDHIKRYLVTSSDRGVLGLTNNFNTDLNVDHVINTFQWAKIFGELSFNVTDSFHGTIFSIRNRTPFLSIETTDCPRDKSKKFLFLSYIGLEDLYVDMKEQKNNLGVIINKKEEILFNWKSKYLPIIERGLVRISKDLEDFNNLIMKKLL